MNEKASEHRIGILEMPGEKFVLRRTLEIGYGAEKAQELVASARRFVMLVVNYDGPPGFSTSDELDDALAFFQEQWRKTGRDGISDFRYDMNVSPEIRARVNAFAASLKP